MTLTPTPHWNAIVDNCVQNGATTISCIPALFQSVIEGLLIFVGIVAFFLLMFSGVKLMLARGEAKELETAKHTATYAIAGLVLVLFSFLIINLIAYITGVDCIRFFGFTNCQ